jgi:hypothetical protein
MTSSKRAPFWLPPISLAAMALVIILISFAWKMEPFAVTAQLFLLFVILRAFAYWPPMRRWIVAMPVPHRVLLGVLLGGMILGHYSLNGRTYFPFVVWEIFPSAHEVDPVRCREFIATTASGAKVRLLAEQQFPSIVQIDPVDALENPTLYPPGTTEQLARALAKMYNAHHAADPVRQVDLMEMAVELHPPANELRNEPSCELLKRYDISSDR